MSDLFRKEAVSAATSRLDGKVMFPSLLRIWVLGGLLIIIIATAVTFLSLAEYERKQTVAGWIVPENGAVRAAALRGGIVEDTYVIPGAQVEKGTPLLALRLSAETAEGDILSVLNETLEAQVEAARNGADATLERIDAEDRRLLKLISGRETEQIALTTQIQAQTQRLQQMTETALWARENFEEGLTTRADAESWKLQKQEIEQDLLTLKRALRSTETEIEDFRRQLDRLPAERRTAMSERDQVIAALNERTVRNEADGQYILTAPVAGRVEVVPIEKGQLIASGETGAILTPEGDALLAEIFVPSRAIGFIETGQEVRLKYDAFPFQSFGTGQAVIEDISQTILAPDEVSLAGISLQEPVFRVRARIKSDQIEAYGRDITLRSGLTLTADVIVDDRTLIEWLLDPLFAAGRA
ncbi:HlyD family efflux transporter periplasmic adaptor subunit [Hyphomonas sp. FCG-A18]|uniref:HlyD family efflux transporter periplasmic adaptor subunit n=1 Tax=Hyphomonas sp. FCG-A18 TaxID=3080019 RepID=UPI002B2BBE6F|nr:HlyD family efflux transporter periplasmic adaptor subunit [Hyphomonas sp. FCG-A18]